MPNDDLISKSELRKTFAEICPGDCSSCDYSSATDGRLACAIIDDSPPAIDAEPGWISVEERLPDIDAEVLIYTDKGLYDVAQYSGGERFWTLERNPDCWVTALGVTHWMPFTRNA